MPLQQFFLVVLPLVVVCQTANAFSCVSPVSLACRLRGISPYRKGTQLFGISEWRRSSGIGNNKNSDDHSILLLPLSPLEVPLLPGESKILRFTQGQQMETLESAMESYSSVVGGVLKEEDTGCNNISDSNVPTKDTVFSIFPLCEISKYSLESGTVSLKCAGRAQLSELQQPQTLSGSVRLGICQEIKDSDIATDCLDECEELVENIEQLLATMTAQNSQYQRVFWVALAALGYSPTVLLTSDPVSSNSQKELEAASWASMTVLVWDDMDEDDETSPIVAAAVRRILYQAFATTSPLERLQLARRSLLAQRLEWKDSVEDVDGNDTDGENYLGSFE